LQSCKRTKLHGCEKKRKLKSELFDHIFRLYRSFANKCCLYDHIFGQNSRFSRWMRENVIGMITFSGLPSISGQKVRILITFDHIGGAGLPKIAGLPGEKHCRMEWRRHGSVAATR
jgi:hypothetical protein